MDKEYFLLKNRSIKKNAMAFSIASSWIWAPALILSAQKGYSHGILGSLAFLLPNVLTLILFGYFAKKIRKQYLNEFTFTGIISNYYQSKKMHYIYLFQHVALQISCLAVQLLAGAKILNQFIHIDFSILTIGLAFIPMTYIYYFGITGSIISDMLKLLLLIIGLGILCPIAFIKAYPHLNFVNGIWGISNLTHSFFDKSNLTLLVGFIIPSTIGLISGPFGDQAFYQRTFAVKKEDLVGSFNLSALLFSIVPLAMSFLGICYAASPIGVVHSDLPHLSFVSTMLGENWLYALIFLIILALLSAIDSHYSALSCLGGHDINNLSKLKNNSILLSRLIMIVGGSIAIVIANIPNLQIVHLFLFYGTLRSSTLTITILTILNKKLEERFLVFGLLFSMFICLPVFVWANLNSSAYIISISSLATILSPILITYLLQYFYKQQRR
jgi:Na+/proline symporter